MMPHQTITVDVPEETYEPFRQQAERAQQTIEEAVLRAMHAALADGESAAESRQTTLAALALLDTATLWQLVRRGAETDDVLLLAALNEKRQAQELTAAEEGVVHDLIRRHDRAVLIRAKALALLRERGDDMSALVDDA